MTWYYKHGYSKNPFEKNTLKADDSLIDYDKQLAKILHWTESGNIIMLKGQRTSGKTRLVKEIIKKYGGKKKVALLKDNKEFDVSQVLSKNKSLLKKIFNKKPKDMILILDNYDSISTKNQKNIQYYFDQNNIKSVIITTNKNITLIPSLKDRLGTRILTLKTLSKPKQLEIIKKRINNEKFFSTKLLKKLQKHSKTYNDLLDNAQRAALLAEKKGNKTVTKKTIDTIIKGEK